VAAIATAIHSAPIPIAPRRTCSTKVSLANTMLAPGESRLAGVSRGSDTRGSSAARGECAP
jgi:hypothetical protein